MGLIVRLAWRNLRKHPQQAIVLLLVMCVSTTTVSLGLALNETAHQPWNRLHDTINGFHVRAVAGYHTEAQQLMQELPQPDRENVAHADGLLSALAAEPEVAQASGPWPLLLTRGRIGGVSLPLWAEVRDPEPAAVSQPLMTSGRWLDGSDDVVVLEDGMASLLKVKPDDEVTIGGHHMRVLGSAMTTSIGRYPTESPAAIWTNRATAAKLRAAGAIPLGAVVELRLTRLQDAATFVAVRSHDPAYTLAGSLRTWERARTRATQMAALTLALSIIAMLLAGLTVATAAVLVTGRMAARSIQIGVLKAIGVTPRQALGMVMVEYLAVAMVAAAIGVVAGTLLSPLVVRNMVNLYGAPAAPPITWQRAAIALAAALAVVAVGSVQPALRGVRQSTMRALTAGVRPPRRSSRVARLAARIGVPLPVVLGVRSALRRPGRTIANATGLALGVTMVVLGLGIYHGAQDFLGTPAANDVEALARIGNAILIEEVLGIVFGGAGFMMALAAFNAAVVATIAARDNARHHAILRAVGATPGQTVVSFIVAQLCACLLGCAAGMVSGVLLFNAAVAGEAKDLGRIALPASAYVLLAVAVPLLYLLVVIAPAARLARQPVAQALTYE
jgi:putative ABC transport system permease protein